MSIFRTTDAMPFSATVLCRDWLSISAFKNFTCSSELKGHTFCPHNKPKYLGASSLQLGAHIWVQRCKLRVDWCHDLACTTRQHKRSA